MRIGICDHRQLQSGHAFYGPRSLRVMVQNQILNPVDSSKLRFGTQHLRSSNRECRKGGAGNKGTRRRWSGNSIRGRTTELTNSKQRAQILPPTWRTPRRHRVESDGTWATTSRSSDPQVTSTLDHQLLPSWPRALPQANYFVFTPWVRNNLDESYIWWSSVKLIGEWGSESLRNRCQNLVHA
jgi:hypothetical protein